MKNGFLYPLFDGILTALKYLNLVEFFKVIAGWLSNAEDGAEKKRSFERIAVDIFIILKWSLVGFLWANSKTNEWWSLVVWYLIITNLYTYFYYHAWCKDSLMDRFMSIERIKRRFFNLLCAVAYNFFAFSYLYSLPYAYYFHNPDTKTAFFYSIANSLTAGCCMIENVMPDGEIIAALQVLISFTFFTIILSNSIPNVHNPNTENTNS